MTSIYSTVSVLTKHAQSREFASCVTLEDIIKLFKVSKVAVLQIFNCTLQGFERSQYLRNTVTFPRNLCPSPPRLDGVATGHKYYHSAVILPTGGQRAPPIVEFLAGFRPLLAHTSRGRLRRPNLSIARCIRVPLCQQQPLCPPPANRYFSSSGSRSRQACALFRRLDRPRQHPPIMPSSIPLFVSLFSAVGCAMAGTGLRIRNLSRLGSLFLVFLCRGAPLAASGNHVAILYSN